MCISAATAMLIGSLASAAGTIYNADRQRKAAHEAADAARNAQAQAETSGAQTANARIAQRRRALAANSLVTDQSAGQTGMAAPGRTSLGG